MTTVPLPGESLLRICALVVPSHLRDEWLAEWTAEVTHTWRDRSTNDDAATAWSLRMRCIGALADAIWMRRTHGFNRRRSTMFWHDIRHAVRAMRRRPGFASVVVATLATCIAASTATFSMVDSVLIDGLPYRDIDRVVSIWSNDTRNARERNQVSVGDYYDIRDRSRTTSAVAAYFPNWNVTYTTADASERLDVGIVTSNFLSTLGVGLEMGREFSDAEEHPGGPKSVILSNAFWTRHFARDSSVLGRSVTLDGEPYTVIGVLKPDFVFPEATVDLLAPMPLLGNFITRREVHLVTLIARLNANTSVEQARHELQSIAAQLEREHPSENAGMGATVLPLRTALLGDVRRPIVLLFTAACAVLLIGCANVASLMLASATSRRPELAIRTALGAERSTIVRQLLTESAVIAVASGLVGSLMAVGAVRVLAMILPARIGHIAVPSIDARALLFALLATVLTTLVCGLAPAIRSAKSAMMEGIADAVRATHSRRRRRMQSLLVVSQLAASLILVVAAGLLVNSFERLASTNPGFRTTGLVRMKVTLSGVSYNNPITRIQFVDRLLDAVQRVPGVERVGAVSRFPLHDANVTTSVFVEGTDRKAGALPDADMRNATAGYFEAMGVPLVAGRAFSSEDRAGSASTIVALINQAAARELFHGTNPVGRRIQLGGDSTGPYITVVGVVGDMHDASLREPSRPQLFMPVQQTAPRGLSFVLRYSGNSAGVVAAVRRELRALDPALPMYDVQKIEDVMSIATANDRFTTALLTTFSSIALFLALLGTYAVIARGVADRTREIGIRMALGARASSVRAMVMREGALLVGIAIPIGLAGSLASARLLASQLFGVSPLDALTLVIATVALCASAALACYLPARRASRVDPMVAVRAD